MIGLRPGRPGRVVELRITLCYMIPRSSRCIDFVGKRG
jgi:hypothetical protein